MDFIEGLPQSHQANCIMVVVDIFSKYSHFVPLHHPFTAMTVARQFMDNVFKLHGFPQAIVTDRDKIFTSALWKELFHIADVELRMTTAYHPQSDGQTERVNQCLETYLCCFVQACPTKWKLWLHWQSFGTIRAIILLSISLHLKYYMVILHVDWVLILESLVL